MISKDIRRATLVALGVGAAMAANSAWAQTADQGAQVAGEDMGVITVTGSRMITDNARSPTPITAVDIAEIALTTPSDIADALNKLPRSSAAELRARKATAAPTTAATCFRCATSAAAHPGAAGRPPRRAEQPGRHGQHRHAAADAGQRVDIVTGGASAIYGSDAVAGVVNYVLDKDFTGLSVKADFGMSDYGDGEQ